MRFLLLLVASLLFGSGLAALKDGDCEVCLKAINEVKGKLSESERKDIVKIEDKLGAYCAKPPSEKEIKLCYYLDPIKREVSQPMKNGVPVEKICERLKKKSAEICSLRFGSSPGTPSMDKVEDFNKLRVNQLKSLMASKGISCPECIEKGDYVRKLEEVLGKPGAKKEL